MRPPTAAVLVQRRGRLFQHDHAGQRIALPSLALLGPCASGRTWSTAPGSEFWLVNLAPGALEAIFGLDPGATEGEVGALESNVSESLLDSFANTVDPLAMGAALDHATPTGFRCESVGGTLALAAFTALEARSLGERVGEYADHFGVTVRTLQRATRAAVGLTPKQIIAVSRIRSLISLTAAGWATGLADLAQAGGYYDQSHMRYDLARHDYVRACELVDGGHLVVSR